MGVLDIDGSRVVDALDHPTVVADSDGGIVHANDKFRALVDESSPTTLEESLAGFPALRDQLQAREEGVVQLETEDDDRHYQVSVSSVCDDAGVAIGDLVVLQDVTEHRRRQHHLEHRNERLDQFASRISHDLRNPLDVAIGRATVIRELVDDDDTIEEHLGELDSSHARMRRIIHDVLTLAREGRRIDETTAVRLSEGADRAWSHVQTENASLEVTTDGVVMADRERLEQAFENLFRNSLEHGCSETSSDQITVRIGTRDDGAGFYVADDGEGFDEAATERMLEAGYTGSDDNTGLGLAIVHTIADAHGWEVTACESADGGARFEFDGVEYVDDDQLLQGG